MEALGGSIWSIAIVAGPIILAIGLAYGTIMYRKRRRERAQARRRDPAPPELRQRQ